MHTNIIRAHGRFLAATTSAFININDVFTRIPPRPGNIPGQLRFRFR
jgi:hypothetical protein